MDGDDEGPLILQVEGVRCNVVFTNNRFILVPTIKMEGVTLLVTMIAHKNRIHSNHSRFFSRSSILLRKKGKRLGTVIFIHTFLYKGISTH